MKILYFITKSEAGGAQTHVAQLTHFFVSRGDEVAIMSAPGGWLETEVQNIGARFYQNPSLSNALNPLRLMKASRAFLDAVKDFKPDLVSCHSTMAGFIGRCSLRNRIPTVFTAHGWGFTQGSPLRRRLTIPWFEKLAAYFCSRIICVSQNDLHLAHQHHITHPDKLVQIYNGIELPSLSVKKHVRDAIHIFFVGRLAPPKDPFQLIKAYQRLSEEERLKIQLHVIGSGPKEKALRDTIQRASLEHRVKIHGALPRTAVLQLLRDEADLFVFLSHWEGFPYTILEAMAYGLPIIASDVGGVKEALGEDTGILIQRGDVEALTKALQTLIYNPSLRMHMGAQARKRTRRNFCVEDMCQKTLAVFQQLV